MHAEEELGATKWKGDRVGFLDQYVIDLIAKREVRDGKALWFSFGVA